MISQYVMWKVNNTYWYVKNTEVLLPEKKLNYKVSGFAKSVSLVIQILKMSDEELQINSIKYPTKNSKCQSKKFSCMLHEGVAGSYFSPARNDILVQVVEDL